MGRVVTGSEAWIRASEAPKRVHRDRSTVYRWVASGRVRSMATRAGAPVAPA